MTNAPEVVAAVVFTALCAGLGLAMLLTIRVVTWWLGTTCQKEGKHEPYECGVPLLGSARVRLDVRFYTVALLFVIFDVETVFLFPYAVSCRRLGVAGLVEALVFVGVLALGLYYLWRRGALDWE